MMKKLFLGLASLVVLVAVAVVAAPSFIPVEVYKEQITAAAHDATGRDLMIDGDVSLTVFPRLELQAKDVAFSNAAGGRAPQMVSLDELVVRLQVMPLLSGEVRVDSFVLINPVVALEVDHNGASNWTFGSRSELSETEAATGADAPAPAVAEISLGDVRLVNGKVSYRDARTAKVVELSGINLSVALPSLDAPFELDGSVVWNEKTIALTIEGANARALMAGDQSAVTVSLTTDVIEVEYEGTVRPSEPLTLGGKVRLNVPSIRELAAWAGSPVDAPGEGLGPLSIAGDLGVKGSQISFSKATIGLDGMAASGDFRVETGGKVPHLRGRLDWDQLDLNLYMAGGTAKEFQGKTTAKDRGAGDWSDDEIDFSGLTAANADFDLSVGEILFQQIKVGRSAVKVGLKDGRLVVDLTELALYGGKGIANVVINARAKVPLIRESMSVTGLQLEPFLIDAAGFDKMDGTGNLTYELNTHGRTEREIVAGLSGSGEITLTDGIVRGLSLSEMIRNSASAFLGKADRKEAKTDFAAMNGTFAVHNGVVTNTDLYMVGLHAEVSGSGTADMNRRTVKYRLVPKATLETEGTAAAASITVPVIVSGSWDDLKFRPDLKALVDETLKDPKKAVKDVKKTLKALKKQGIGSFLEELKRPPTQAPATGDGTAPAPQNVDPKQLLEGLFGG